jgi:ABC-2 type transport system ATP-binding protein
VIEVKNLVKRYGKHVAVDHLSFTVEKGQIYGFLGPNGAGKSTTMNIMTGYLGATEGEVLVNGHSILEEPEAAKACIGYLPEWPPLYVEMTVLEYLFFAAELKKVPKAERNEQITKIMKMTFLEDVKNRLIKNLSKGYKQRVGLAQALLGFPPVIILDEPTVGLDPKQIIEIRDLIRDLAQEHTVILSSHILSEVQEVCDHILIIHHGKLLASGSPAELEQMLTGSGMLKLEIKGNRDAIENLLKEIDGVESVVLAAGDDTAESVMLTLAPKKGADPREAVFRACAAADLPILMMQREHASLEQIFLELTSDSSAEDTVPNETEETASVPELDEEVNDHEGDL